MNWERTNEGNMEACKVAWSYIDHPGVPQELGEEIFAISYYTCEAKENRDISETQRGQNTMPIFKRHR